MKLKLPFGHSLDRWLIVSPSRSRDGKWHIIPPAFDTAGHAIRTGSPLLGARFNTGAEALAAFNRGHP